MGWTCCRVRRRWCWRFDLSLWWRASLSGRFGRSGVRSLGLSGVGMLDYYWCWRFAWWPGRHCFWSCRFGGHGT